jgi:hypothetical protein
MEQKLFTLQLFSTIAMTGIILLVQFVHYPTFHYVDVTRAQEFQMFHVNQITKIVMPLMLIELITIIALSLLFPKVSYFVLAGLTVGIFLLTFFLSVPLHNQLLTSWQSALISKLVFTNYPRTILWCFKSLTILGMMWKKIA